MPMSMSTDSPEFLKELVAMINSKRWWVLLGCGEDSRVAITAVAVYVGGRAEDVLKIDFSNPPSGHRGEINLVAITKDRTSKEVNDVLDALGHGPSTRVGDHDIVAFHDTDADAEVLAVFAVTLSEAKIIQHGLN